MAFVGEDADDSARRLTSLLSRSSGFVLCICCCAALGIEIRRHVDLALVDEARASAISPAVGRRHGAASRSPARDRVQKAWRSARHHALLRLGHIGERVAHPMHAAALPSRRRPDGSLSSAPRAHRISPASPRAVRAASGSSESRPKRLSFRRSNMQADNLALALSVAATAIMPRPRRCVRPRAASGRSRRATDRPSPASGRSRNACTRSSISLHSF